MTWSWVVETDKGRFYVDTVGIESQAEASRIFRAFFDEAGLAIIGMSPRKRYCGEGDRHMTVCREKDGRDTFYCAKAVWAAAGRLAEFEARLIVAKKEYGLPMHDE